ncbi:hypothetical protein MMF93_09430 [Streptomyces tubbatahanensis]|uniref:Uncharacterized protein n=1 Tax=Streptomyces tubbatahanensis TaxID=2923272 RepID=A0ABY3XQP2_9ACTN|nr:hypothetical protein [Streptomyces tubbatahanensis]UNS96711.1 hypothetical protein MMF93_09430 [Streptomyces tubbatahanensis]
MPTEQFTRHPRTPWCARALLLAALLLGLVTMHTLGHPSPEPASAAPTAAPTAAVAASTARGGDVTPTAPAEAAGPPGYAMPVAQAVPGADSAPAGQNASIDQAAHAAHAAAPPQPGGHGAGHGDGHGTGMDPTSVCLAVLGVWSAVALLGLLVLLVLRRRRVADLAAAYRTRLLRTLWPLPPPRTAVRLARLSILRT